MVVANTQPKRYRVYIDESGDHTFSQLGNPAHRYLALTGIAIEQEYYRSTLHPTFEALKQKHFPHSPDDPVVMVRSKIVRRNGPFGRLRNPALNAAWETDFLDFLGNTEMRIYTVVIDKRDHLAQYGKAAWHPYHYCLTVILERARGWLNVRGGVTDVLAESRGKREDRELRSEYQKLWNQGTYYITASDFRQVLTSKKLKCKRKSQNIAGLQLADLIAAPSKVDILAQNSRHLAHPPSNFTNQINQTIRVKYDAYGRIFLH